jgi:hypothetical protein
MSLNLQSSGCAYDLRLQVQQLPVQRAFNCRRLPLQQLLHILGAYFRPVSYLCRTVLS